MMVLMMTMATTNRSRCPREKLIYAGPLAGPNALMGMAVRTQHTNWDILASIGARDLVYEQDRPLAQ